MQIPTHVRVGVTILAVGVLPWLYTTYPLNSHNWDPLTVPVALLPGEFESPPFKTDLTGTYVVSLVFEPMPDARKQDCQIGEELVKWSCVVTPRTLYLNWSVLAGGKEVVAPSPYSPRVFSSSPGEDETELGTFEGKNGQWQTIRLNVLSDAGELNSAHPRLKVEAHRVYWEKWVIFGQLAFLCGGLLALIGLAVIFLPQLLYRRPTVVSN